MEENKKKIEELKQELEKQGVIKNKKLMLAMWTLLIISTAFYFMILFLAINTLEKGILLATIISTSTIIFIIACFIALKLEVDAGYYECKKCHHKFIPTYKDALLAMHISTIRYLKCPECKKRSWAKKVMSNLKE